MIIYKATNKENGKIYIGQSVETLAKRKAIHIRDANNNNSLYFHKALRKYGVDNFKWQVICICPNIDILNEQEVYYIAFYDSFNNGYNLTKGGDGTVGYKFSEEQKEKMSGENNHMYGKCGEDHHNYGKPMSEDQKAKIRQSHLGEKNHFYGKKHSEATKEQMRIDKQNISDDTRKKMSDANKGNIGEKNHFYGKKHSEESKQKMRTVKLGKKLSDEHKQKISKNSARLSGKDNPMWGRCGEDHPMYGKHHSNETKKKLSEATKKYWDKKRVAI